MDTEMDTVMMFMEEWDPSLVYSVFPSCVSHVHRGNVDPPWLRPPNRNTSGGGQRRLGHECYQNLLWETLDTSSTGLGCFLMDIVVLMNYCS